jgi:hypothetical protein
MPLTRLPDNLTVEGDLDISSTDVTSLPKGLTIKYGVLDLQDTKIKSLPPDLKAGYVCPPKGMPVSVLKKAKIGLARQVGEGEPSCGTKSYLRWGDNYDEKMD